MDRVTASCGGGEETKGQLGRPRDRSQALPLNNHSDGVALTMMQVAPRRLINRFIKSTELTRKQVQSW